MAKFRIRQLEIHVQDNEVEGEDLAEAIHNLLEGEGEQVGSFLFLETCTERGMSTEQLDQETFNKLQELGVICSDDSHVPSVFSFERL